MANGNKTSDNYLKEGRIKLVEELVGIVASKLSQENSIKLDVALMMAREHYMPQIQYLVDRELESIDAISQVLRDSDKTNRFAEIALKFAENVPTSDIKDLSPPKYSGQNKENENTDIKPIDLESLAKRIGEDPSYTSNEDLSHQLLREYEGAEKEFLRRNPATVDQVENGSVPDLAAQIPQSPKSSKPSSPYSGPGGFYEKAKQKPRITDQNLRDTGYVPNADGTFDPKIREKEARESGERQQRAEKREKESATRTGENYTERPSSTQKGKGAINLQPIDQGLGDVKSFGLYAPNGKTIKIGGKDVLPGVGGTSNRDVAALAMGKTKGFVRNAGEGVQNFGLKVQRVGDNLENTGANLANTEGNGLKAKASRLLGENALETGKQLGQAGEAIKDVGDQIKKKVAIAAARAVGAVMPTIASILIFVLGVGILATILIIILCKALDTPGLGNVASWVVPEQLRGICKGLGFSGGCDSAQTSGNSITTLCLQKDLEKRNPQDKIALWRGNGGVLSQDGNVSVGIIREVIEAGKKAGVSNETIAFVLSVAPTETGSNSNPWSIRGGSGNAFLGIAQVGENPELPTWSQAGLGRTVSAGEFLSNPPVQMKVIEAGLKEKISFQCAPGKKSDVYEGAYAWLTCDGKDGNGTTATAYAEAAERNFKIITCTGATDVPTTDPKIKPAMGPNQTFDKFGRIFGESEVEAISSPEATKLIQYIQNNKFRVWEQRKSRFVPRQWFIDDINNQGIEPGLAKMLTDLADKGYDIQINGLGDKSHGDTGGDHNKSPIAAVDIGAVTSGTANPEDDSISNLAKFISDANSTGVISKVGVPPDLQGKEKELGVIQNFADGPGHLHFSVKSGVSALDPSGNKSNSSSSTNCTPCPTARAEQIQTLAQDDKNKNFLGFSLVFGVNQVLAVSNKPNSYSDLSADHLKFLNTIASERGYMSYPNKGGLNSGLQKAFDDMKAAAAKEGRNLSIVSGYRSFDDQVGTFFNNSGVTSPIKEYWYANATSAELATIKAQYLARAEWSAPPGFSEHSTGMGIDINSLDRSFENTEEYKWLKINAAKYGFVESYPSGSIKGAGFEPWHWRWDGNTQYPNVEPVSKLAGQTGDKSSSPSNNTSSSQDCNKSKGLGADISGANPQCDDPANKSKPECGQEDNGQWLHPMSGKGEVTACFGNNSCSAHGNRMHNGVDIAAPEGTPIIASVAGKVTYAENGCTVGDFACGGAYGNGVVLVHNRPDANESTYNHMKVVYVKVGQSVRQGQVIGLEGTTGSSTGPHIHFEIKQSGSFIDPCTKAKC